MKVYAIKYNQNSQGNRSQNKDLHFGLLKKVSVKNVGDYVTANNPAEADMIALNWGQILGDFKVYKKVNELESQGKFKYFLSKKDAKKLDLKWQEVFNKVSAKMNNDENTTNVYATEVRKAAEEIKVPELLEDIFQI